MIDASFIKQLKAQLAERMQINVKLFSRDQITIEASIPPELLAGGRSTAEALPEPDHAESSQPAAPHAPVSVVVANIISAVRAWDLEGSRAHLEFELSDRHVSSRFTAQGNSVIEAFLDELEKDANERKSAVSLALPVSQRHA